MKRISFEDYLKTDPRSEITIRMNPETGKYQTICGFGNSISGIYMDMDSQPKTFMLEFIDFANLILEQPVKFYEFIEYWGLEGMEIEEQIVIFRQKTIQREELMKMFAVALKNSKPNLVAVESEK